MFQRLSTWGVFDELGGDGGDCHRKVVSGRKIAGARKYLVNTKSLQFD